MVDFISRAEVTTIKLALLKKHTERVQAAIPGLAAAREGGLEAVRAVLEAKSDELSASFDGLVAAAIAEIHADEG